MKLVWDSVNRKPWMLVDRTTTIMSIFAMVRCPQPIRRVRTLSDTISIMGEGGNFLRAMVEGNRLGEI